MKLKLQHYLLSVLVVCTALLQGNAFAQNATAYPKGPVKIIVNFPAGGTVDTLARLVGQRLSEQWGKPVTIENRPGAGGNIGTQAAYLAEPDGLTLLASPPGPLTINQNLYKDMTFDPSKFVPIITIAQVPNVITARIDFPANTEKELIAYVKANPGKVTFASQGNGSTSHLTAQLLSNLAGLKMVHVPYKGEGPALIDLMAGRVDLFVGNISAVVKFRDEKKVKFIAVASQKRSLVAPDVPTAAEAGLPGFNASAWFALVAPPGTPTSITEDINKQVNEILKVPYVRARIQALGGDVGGGSSKELGAFMAQERIRWKQVIDSSHVTMD